MKTYFTYFLVSPFLIDWDKKIYPKTITVCVTCARAKQVTLFGVTSMIRSYLILRYTVCIGLLIKFLISFIAGKATGNL
jgi:hypothetical protein